MSITEIGLDTWALNIRVFRDGTEHRHRSTFKGSRRSAQKLHDERLRALRVRAEQSSSSFSVKTFGEALDYYEQRHPAPSAVTYLRRLRADLGGVRISELRSRWDRWAALVSETPTRYGRLPSPATMNRYLGWARAGLSYCEKRQVGPANPLKCFEKSRETPRDVRFSEIDERHLLNAVDATAPYLSALVRFALAVPVRLSEALAMQKADVDLFGGYIRSRIGTMKGGRMAALKPIPPCPVVRHHLQNLPTDCEAVWYRREEAGNVPIVSFMGAWLACTKAAGLPGLRFHDLRHVAVTRMLNAGTPAQAVMQIAGWTSPAMIQNYYRLDGAQALRLVRFNAETQHSSGSAQEGCDNATGQLTGQSGRVLSASG